MAVSPPWHSTDNWTPTQFIRFERGLGTSLGTAEIITDAAEPFGKAYIKALGNPLGPHPLAKELVGTQLAQWFDLPVFDHAIIEIDSSIDEIEFLKGGIAESGPAFITKATKGIVWGGDSRELSRLVNPEDVGRIVVFDNWTRNWDRFPPDLTGRSPNYDNVFIESIPDSDGEQRLIAMDHSECFTWGRDLTPRNMTINEVQDDQLYGVFPGFVDQIRQVDVENAIDDLSQLDVNVVREIVELIPNEWEVEPAARDALVNLICQRASFVAETVLNRIAQLCWPDQLFDTN